MERLEGILSELSHLDLAGEIVDKEPHASGLGGSCDVCTAWSRKHERKVAVKQVRAFLKKDLTLAKRLAREICIWAKLYHENILPLLGYFTEGDNAMPAFVSEFMERGTLYEVMQSFPRSSLETCTMIRDIARGLDYLHSKSVVHADLKSHNILISKDAKPLLADFGLSLALSESMAGSTTTGAFAKGTVRWMARELLAPDDSGSTSRPDEQTDIWAFGMVIYELISWKLPYWNKNSDILIFMGIVNGELPEIPDDTSDADSEIFRSLWELCRCCWSSRGSRYSTRMILDFVSEIIQKREDSLNRLTRYSHCEGTVWHTTQRGGKDSNSHRCRARLNSIGGIAFACDQQIVWEPILSKGYKRYKKGGHGVESFQVEFTISVPDLLSNESYNTEAIRTEPPGICSHIICVDDSMKANEWKEAFGDFKLYSSPIENSSSDLNRVGLPSPILPLLLEKPPPYSFLPSPSSISFEASGIPFRLTDDEVSTPGLSQPFETQQHSHPTSRRPSNESLHELLELSEGGKAARHTLKRSKQKARPRSYGRRAFVANGRTPPISSCMEKPQSSPPS
ncbi:kinase-like protein [Schizopora paradoxa]|uniref:Kinase-like protein n=1 Tax=Schizopora paradoxa TaxID=27342 RepID=A0A0H2RQF2_9AGAM|nr:kinase-like protein [Schizopora paradoxa]